MPAAAFGQLESEEDIEIVEEEAEGDTAEPEVVVTGRRSRETAGGRTLDQSVLTALPRRSAEDLLRAAPGVYVVQHGAEGKGPQLYLRGFDAAHGADVEVRLGGVPLNEWSNIHGNGYLDLGAVIPEGVRRLKVVRGTSQLDQGPFANAGSMAFELGVEEQARGLRGSYQIGDTGRHRVLAMWAPKDRAASDFVALEAMQDEGFGARRAARRLSANGQWTLWREGADRLQVMALAYGADFELPGALRRADVDTSIGLYDAYSDQNDGDSARGLLALRHQTLVAGALVKSEIHGRWRHLSLDEHFTGWVNDPDCSDSDCGDRRLQREETWGGGGRVHVSKPLGESWMVRGLVEGRLDRIDQSARGLYAARPDQPATAAEGTEGALDRGAEITAGHLAAGAGVQWFPLNGVQIDAGVRIDAFSASATDVVTNASGRDWTARVLPRISGRAPLGGHVTVLAAAGRGIRPPETQAAATGQLSPVASDQGELGLRWSPVPALTLGAAVFGIWMERESIFDHVSGRTVEQSASERLGGEFELELRPGGHWLISSDVTWARAQLTDSGESVPGAPPLLATVKASLSPPRGLRASMLATAIGPRPLAFGAEAKAAQVVDGALGWRADWWALDLQVQNLLDTRWHEGEYVYASWWDTTQPRSQLPVAHVIPGSPRMVRLMLSAWW
ncbi:MAG: TonB-dependent receptor [Bradymonadia bacterium]